MANIYETAKKHKLVKALKKHIESNGHSFDEYLIDRFVQRTGKEDYDEKNAVMVETIALYMMATHASKEKLEAIMDQLK